MAKIEPSDEDKKLLALVKQAVQRHKPKEKEKDSIRIPYEALMGKQVQRPILEPELDELLIEAVAPLKNAYKWKRWGMDRYDAFGTTLLFTGPSGTGKTTAARYLAKEVSGGMISITMADVGGGDPGSTERNTVAVFDEAKRRKNCTIFIDECDGLLWSRDKAGPDSMWMLGVVNNFLQQIEKFSGLTILATNNAHVLDSALKRRITETIEFPVPTYVVRLNLWTDKLPEPFIKITQQQLNEIAKLVLTGAEIERAIEKEARVAIREGRNPRYESLLLRASKLVKK